MKYLLLLLLTALCHAQEVKQTVWLSNDTIYVSAWIPACYYARWERGIPITNTNNWLGVDAADYSFTTREVVFSERLPAFQSAWYRLVLIYVPWCASIQGNP